MKTDAWARAAVFLATLVMVPVRADAQVEPGQALAATCANCHGTGGRARGEMKSLAGLPAERIVAAVNEFRSGARPSTIMQQIAKGYTEAQVQQIAAWFAAQPTPH